MILRRCWLLLFLVGFFFSQLLHAQNPSENDKLEIIARAFLQQQLSQLHGEFVITFSPLTTPNPPCANPQAFNYPNQRLIGNVVIGISCQTAKGNQQRFIRANVQPVLTFLEARNNIVNGQLLTPDDFIIKRAPANKLPRQLVNNPALIKGQQAAGMLRKGSILLQSNLRPIFLIRRNSDLTVIAQGSGFQITTPAKALQNGAHGQTIKVRLANGQIVNAIIVDQKTAKVGF